MEDAIVSFLIKAKKATYAGKGQRHLPQDRSHMIWCIVKMNTCIMIRIWVERNLPAKKPYG